MDQDVLADGPKIKRGNCHVLFAYDVAAYIDLQQYEKQIAAGAQRQSITRRRRALEYFEYRPAPLAFTIGTSPMAVGRFRSRESVEVVIYDFGAVSVSYSFPLAGPLQKLIGLSTALYGQEELELQSRRLVADLFKVMPDNGEVRIAGVVEDYVIFHIEEFEDGTAPSELLTIYSGRVAQILRAEAESLSEQEVQDAVARRISFGHSDVAVLDWNAALLYGKSVDDLRTVIEFANVQLLELRFLDRQLDAALEESYGLISQRGRRWRTWLRSYRTDVRRVAKLQVDGAILFERVSNALKVFGEEYLSRIYKLTAERLQLAAWDASTLRKLGTLESIYAKLTDEAAARRLEILEWIIVFLIALSIVLSFF